MADTPPGVNIDTQRESCTRDPARRSIVAAAVVLAIAVPAGGAADDQARLDAAMEEFNQRMTAAGWVSTGLPDEATGSFEDEELSASDEQFLECLGDLGAIFEATDDDEFPGQTALSYSEEFEFAPKQGPTNTDLMSLDDQEETAAAFAASVDDANVSTLTTFVEAFGSKNTGDCIREALEADMAADAEDAAIPMEFEFHVATEPDLGAGDHSARMSFTLSMTMFGESLEFDAGVYVAQAGRDLVAVVYGSTGEPTSGFDPLAELETLLDTVSA